MESGLPTGSWALVQRLDNKPHLGLPEIATKESAPEGLSESLRQNSTVQQDSGQARLLWCYVLGGAGPQPHLSLVLCQKLPFLPWSLPKRVRHVCVQKQKRGAIKEGDLSRSVLPSQKAAWGHSVILCLSGGFVIFSTLLVNEEESEEVLSSQPTSRGHHNQVPVVSLTYSASSWLLSRKRLPSHRVFCFSNFHSPSRAFAQKKNKAKWESFALSFRVQANP